MPLKLAPGIKQLQPRDLREIMTYIMQHRRIPSRIEVAVIGGTSGRSKARDAAKVEAFAKAGATWWLESLYTSRNSLQKMRSRILKGPPRVKEQPKRS